jgi:hypothetical protein
VKFGRVLAAAIGGALGIFVSGSAGAVIVNVEYTGSVTSGNDLQGLFGAQGAALTGSVYQANYVFDVTFGLNNFQCISCQSGLGTMNYIFGGAKYGPPHEVSPLISASITIGGATVPVAGTYFSQIFGQNNGDPDGLTEQAHEAYAGATGLALSSEIQNFNGTVGGLPSSIQSAFTYTVGAGDYVASSFFAEDYSSNPDLWIRIAPTSLTVSLDSTPLPATLPLFATGLGAFGLLGWRRKRKSHRC